VARKSKNDPLAVDAYLATQAGPVDPATPRIVSAARLHGDRVQSDDITVLHA
jgi:hypothetical protein